MAVFHCPMICWMWKRLCLICGICKIQTSILWLEDFEWSHFQSQDFQSLFVGWYRCLLWGQSWKSMSNFWRMNLWMVIGRVIGYCMYLHMTYQYSKCLKKSRKGTWYTLTLEVFIQFLYKVGNLIHAKLCYSRCFANFFKLILYFCLCSVR